MDRIYSYSVKRELHILYCVLLTARTVRNIQVVINGKPKLIIIIAHGFAYTIDMRLFPF